MKGTMKAFGWTIAPWPFAPPRPMAFGEHIMCQGVPYRFMLCSSPVVWVPYAGDCPYHGYGDSFTR